MKKTNKQNSWIKTKRNVTAKEWKSTRLTMDL